MMAAAHEPGEIVERLRSALAESDFEILAPVIASDARFESCVGRPQVVDHLGRMLTDDQTLELVDIEWRVDRAIVTFDVRPSTPEQSALEPRRLFAVAFARDGLIFELQLVPDRSQAVAAEPAPPPPPRPDTPTALTSIAAVLPVRDLSAALEHYRRLGFSVREYEGGGYGYAKRDGISLHLSVCPELRPAASTSAVYLYVKDADALFAEWRSAGVSGQFIEPQDTEYGLREGAHIDRDGNLLRFGSPIHA
jgi:hypothetical protein